MHSDLPKTINEAIKILAYNEYFWSDALSTQKTRIHPHPKDLETVKSLAEAQYAWTEKQGKLAVVILKRYLTKFQSQGMDIKKLLDNPQYEEPFRVINFEKSIEKFLDDDEYKIEINFPYNKKLVTLIRILKDRRGLPEGYTRYDGESKRWTFKQTDVSTYYLTLIAIRYDFKFVDHSLLDDFDAVKKEIKGYKQPTARLIGNEVVIDNGSESLQEYWKNNVQNQKPLIQVDRLKEFGIHSKGIKIKAWSELGSKIAHHNSTKAWIDTKEYSRDQLFAAFTELDCFPLIIPVTGDPSTNAEAEEWEHWFKTFERHGIENKHMSFGFDVKEPKRPEDESCEYNDNIVGKMEESKFQVLYEVYQISKQFKYVDKHTKLIFVRNRIPKTLIKSGVKPKCCFVGFGGGYYMAGTGALKRYLDSLPKTLYYNDHQPSSYSWHEKIINKV